MKFKAKRFLGIFLSFALMLGLTPWTTITAEAAVNFSNASLYIGNSEKITSSGVVSNETTGATAGSATVSTEDNSIVLSLENFVYSGKGYVNEPESESYSGAIYYTSSSNYPLIIELTGNNYITVTGDFGSSLPEYFYITGIHSYENLTIRGEGTLTITFAENQKYSRGISVWANNINIQSGTINITTPSSAKVDRSHMVYAQIH